MQVERLVSRMARIVLVDVDEVPVYTSYFDIALIPALVFFYNARLVKVDWGFVHVFTSHHIK